MSTFSSRSPFACPMSGGFQRWLLISAGLMGLMLAIEGMPDSVRKHLAFRMMVVLERI